MEENLPTFTWSPSYVMQTNKNQSLSTMQFGDSYAKNSPLGLNAPFINLQLVFENIPYTEAKEINDFLSNLGGEPFSYYVPFYNKSFIFTCPEWSNDVIYKNVVNVFCEFKEIFYFKTPAISNPEYIKLIINVYNDGQHSYTTGNINGSTYVDAYGKTRLDTTFTYLYTGNLDYVYNGHSGQFNGKLHENYINISFEPHFEYPYSETDLWLNVSEVVWTDASFIIEYIGDHYIKSPKFFNESSSSLIFENRFCDLSYSLSDVTGDHCWSGVYNFSNNIFNYNTGNTYKVFHYDPNDDILNGKKSLYWLWLARLKNGNSVNIYMWNKSCRPENLFFSGGINIMPSRKNTLPRYVREETKLEIFKEIENNSDIPYIALEQVFN